MSRSTSLGPRIARRSGITACFRQMPGVNHDHYHAQIQSKYVGAAAAGRAKM